MKKRMTLTFKSKKETNIYMMIPQALFYHGVRKMKNFETIARR